MAEEIEDLAKALYEARQGTNRPMTEQRWASICERFPATASRLRQEAQQMYEDGEMDS